jgi:hypothetical protein
MKFDRMIVFIRVMTISMKFKLEFSVVCWECKVRAKGCNRTGLAGSVLASPGKLKQVISENQVSEMLV